MIVIVLAIAALVVFVLAFLGAFTLGKMIALGLALWVGAYIAERLAAHGVIRR